MGWMKGYQFIKINDYINKKLNLSKEIKIISFRPNPDKDICRNLHIGVYDNKILVEDFYINPRTNIIVKSKYLTKDDKDKLSVYLSKRGMSYLNYQLYRIEYKELVNNN